MHKCQLFILFSLLSVVYSCKSGEENKSEKAKQEIANTEKDFEKLTAEKGVAEAFSFYADSTAVIKGRNDSLVHGKEGVHSFFSDSRFKNASVTWTADFVDAAASGDLGYTYGKYTWQSKDSTGKVQESTGIFHTVWKKQKDGSWRFVWD